LSRQAGLHSANVRCLDRHRTPRRSGRGHHPGRAARTSAAPEPHPGQPDLPPPCKSRMNRCI